MLGNSHVYSLPLPHISIFLSLCLIRLVCCCCLMMATLTTPRASLPTLLGYVCYMYVHYCPPYWGMCATCMYIIAHPTGVCVLHTLLPTLLGYVCYMYVHYCPPYWGMCATYIIAHPTGVCVLHTLLPTLLGYVCYMYVHYCPPYWGMCATCMYIIAHPTGVCVLHTLLPTLLGYVCYMYVHVHYDLFSSLLGGLNTNSFTKKLSTLFITSWTTQIF